MCTDRSELLRLPDQLGALSSGQAVLGGLNPNVYVWSLSTRQSTMPPPQGCLAEVLCVGDELASALGVQAFTCQVFVETHAGV